MGFSQTYEEGRRVKYTPIWMPSLCILCPTLCMLLCVGCHGCKGRLHPHCQHDVKFLSNLLQKYTGLFELLHASIYRLITGGTYHLLSTRISFQEGVWGWGDFRLQMQHYANRYKVVTSSQSNILLHLFDIGCNKQ